MVKLDIIGHIGQDAKSEIFNGHTVIKFSIAHTEKRRDQQGNDNYHTIWVNCSYWTNKTGLIQYLKKGQQIFATGIPDVNSYTDKTGKAKANLTLRISSIEIIWKRTEGQSDSGNDNRYGQPPSWANEPASQSSNPNNSETGNWQQNRISSRIVTN